jgi:hypothetical protein
MQHVLWLTCIGRLAIIARANQATCTINRRYEGQRMKSIFGLVGILVVLAIVGVLVKTQLKSATSAVAPAAAAAGVTNKT